MVVRFLLSACAAAGLLTAMSAAALADGDAAAGKKVFNKCKICHSLEAGENKIGPSLAGIIDRPAGTIEGFKYSEAMAGSGKTWDAATLDQYLADPKGFIPGTSEEHTSELQSLMRISYAVFCLKKKKNTNSTKTKYLISIYRTKYNQIESDKT